MFKDIITLVKVIEVSDGAGGFENQISSQREVFAEKKSVRQTEFYLAAQADLQAEVIFKIYKLDYDDERTVIHYEKYYSVIRVFETGDFVELTCQRRIGGMDDV